MGSFETLSALALMGFQGQGVAQNYAEAANWYRKAADQRGPAGAYFTFAASELLVGGPSRGLPFP
jgi:TPR repeat protein